MPSLRERLTGAVALATILAGCRPSPPVRPVVGVAYPVWSSLYAELAESALVRAWGDTMQVPRFVLDSSEPDDRLERAVEWTQELLAVPGLSAIVGPSTSRTALAVAPIVNGAGIPQIIPTATTRLLHQAGPWTFRLVPDDSTEGSFLVRQVVARPGLRRVLVLYTNDEYGQGIRLGVREALAREGIAPTAELPVSQDSDFDLLLRNEFQRRRPDAVVAAIRNVELIPVVLGLKHLGSRVPVFAGDGAFWPLALHDRAGTVPFELHAVAFWLPWESDSIGRDFIERFERRAGRTARPEDALAYDALMLAAHAVRGGEGDPQAIRRWLLSLGGSRPAYQGAAGPIAFSGGATRPLRLARFVGDSFVRSDLP
jgi:branched-chain amino acid transport system substrate-binding protein